MAKAIVQISCTKLRSAIEDEATTRWNLTGDLQAMVEALEALMPLLDDAELRSFRYLVSEPEVREWVRRVRKNAYLISDMVDELHDDKRRSRSAPAAGTAVTRILPSCLAIVPKKKNPVANKMKEIGEELGKIRLESASFGFTPSDPSVVVEPAITDDVPVLEESMVLVGRDRSKQEVMAACDAVEAGPVILDIRGEDGVGKTALAAMVFNDTCFEHHSRVWVHAPSQSFDLHKIGEYIISQVSGEITQHPAALSSTVGMEYTTKRLHGVFVGKKVLVVIDDLYLEPKYSSQFKLMFSFHDKHSKVIVLVTTRRYMQHTFFTHPSFIQTRLTDEDSWAIIKHRSHFEDRPESHKQELERIGREIARHNSLPLAAAALGGMLRYKDATGWTHVMDVIDSGFLEEFLREIILLDPFVKLTYTGMPPGLRLCFAYCAIFQIGHCVAKRDLIHQWIALGLLQPSETQLGEQYVRMLLGMSLLQTARPASTAAKDDKFAVCLTMQQKVHACASFVNNELIVLHGETDTLYQNDATEGTSYENAYCRYALLTDVDARPLKLSNILPTQIRALRFVGCSKMELSADTFSFARFLCILDLKGHSMQKLPESICQLRHLGYLNLSACSGLVALPESFGYLTNLLHIDLSGCCRLLNLPESFGKLINLVNIDLSGCTGLVNLPGSLGNLTNLVHMHLSGCSRLEKLPQSFRELINLVHIDLSGCSGLVNLPRSFGKLIKVLRINLSGCSRLLNLPESFGHLINLMHINLSGCSGLSNLPQSFGNLTNLSHIDLSHCHGLVGLPLSFRNLEKLLYLDFSFWSCFEVIQTALVGLSNLQHLNLSHPCCSLAQHRPCLEGLKQVLDQLTKLKYLNLSMFLNPIFDSLSEEKALDYIECISGVSSLEHLDLSHNMFLRDLPESVARLSKLHTLDLSGCIRLKSIAKKIGEMKSLKSIVVRNCRSLKSYHLVVQANDSRSNLVQLENADFVELEISCLENVKSTEEAQRIRMMQKQKLEKLKLCWTLGSQGSVEDNDLLGQLVPPHNVQCLELHGYNGELCLPPWWTPRICSSNLLNLVEVTMVDIPRCKRLPPLGLLPNLQLVVLRRMASITKIDAGDLSLGNRPAFNRLSKLTIDDMCVLEEFNTIYHSGGGEVVMFPTIDELVIQTCPELRFQPEPPRAQKLIISDCNKVMFASGGGPGVEIPSSTSAPVTELVVEGCRVMLQGWLLLHQLPDLRSLTIKNCYYLDSSPEIIRALYSLQTLCFSHCFTMQSLPEGFGGLASLQELQIVSCSDLISLPDTMQQLTSLRSIHVSDCTQFEKLPEWLGDLTSLQKLVIDRCTGIRSLPQSIHQLTKLTDLHISGCQKLKAWCESDENRNMLARIPPKFEAYVAPESIKQPMESDDTNSSNGNEVGGDGSGSSSQQAIQIQQTKHAQPSQRPDGPGQSVPPLQTVGTSFPQPHQSQAAPQAFATPPLQQPHAMLQPSCQTSQPQVYIVLPQQHQGTSGQFSWQMAPWNGVTTHALAAPLPQQHQATGQSSWQTSPS